MSQCKSKLLQIIELCIENRKCWAGSEGQTSGERNGVNVLS